MQSERTILKTLSKDDYTEVLIMYDEPDTFKYIAPLQNLSRDEYIAFLDSRIVQNNSGVGYHWAVRLKENKTFIGLMNLNPIGTTDRIQIGFQLRRKYWNQGFATELTARVLEFGINEAGIKEIYGVFNKENLASGKIFKKLGFEFVEDKKINGEDIPIEIWKYRADLKTD